MKALGIILAGGNSNRMRELTTRRAIAAMPIARKFPMHRLYIEQHGKFAYSEGSGTHTVQREIPA